MLNGPCVYTLTQSVPFVGQVCSDKHHASIILHLAWCFAFQTHRTLVRLALLIMVSHGYARLTRRIVVDDGALLLCL